VSSSTYHAVAVLQLSASERNNVMGPERLCSPAMSRRPMLRALQGCWSEKHFLVSLVQQLLSSPVVLQFPTSARGSEIMKHFTWRRCRARSLRDAIHSLRYAVRLAFCLTQSTRSNMILDVMAPSPVAMVGKHRTGNCVAPSRRTATLNTPFISSASRPSSLVACVNQFCFFPS
jgi:hypothetical protein